MSEVKLQTTPPIMRGVFPVFSFIAYSIQYLFSDWFHSGVRNFYIALARNRKLLRWMKIITKNLAQMLISQFLQTRHPFRGFPSQPKSVWGNFHPADDIVNKNTYEP